MGIINWIKNKIKDIKEERRRNAELDRLERDAMYESRKSEIPKFAKAKVNIESKARLKALTNAQKSANKSQAQSGTMDEIKSRAAAIDKNINKMIGDLNDPFNSRRKK